MQAERFRNLPGTRVNSDAKGNLLEKIAAPGGEGKALPIRVAKKFGLSARGYHRVLRVARTIADLAGSDAVLKMRVAEAVSFRLSISEARVPA